VVDGLLRRLREQHPDEIIKDDLTNYVVRLTDYTVDAAAEHQGVGPPQSNTTNIQRVLIVL
jgi:hypothetical protein